jgi:hypothetical protein
MPAHLIAQPSWKGTLLFLWALRSPFLWALTTNGPLYAYFISSFFMRFLSSIFESISFTLCNGTVFILFNFPPLSPHANMVQHRLSKRRGKLVLWIHVHSLMKLTGPTSQTKKLGQIVVHDQKMPTMNIQIDLVRVTLINLVWRKKRGCYFTALESHNHTKFCDESSKNL